MPSEEREHPSTPSLFLALFGGVMAWSAQLIVDYILVGIRCHAGGDVFSWGVTVFSLLMALITAIALVTGYRAWKMTGLGMEAHDPVDPANGRAALMALGGIMFNVLFLVLILASMAPNTFMDPCRYIP